MTIDQVTQGAVLRHRKTGRHWRVMYSPGRHNRQVFVWLQEIGTQKTRHSLIQTVLEKFECVVATQPQPTPA